MIAFPSNRSCPRCKGEMQYICLTSFPPQYKARCLYCGYEEGEDVKQPQTNADRVRSMTDEELANVLKNPCDNGDYMPTEWCKARNCGYRCALDWLRQEASE